MKSITAVKTSCKKCGWWGIVSETEPDVDGDGNLGCPQCFSIVHAGAYDKPPTPNTTIDEAAFKATLSKFILDLGIGLAPMVDKAKMLDDYWQLYRKAAN